jgi:putative ABC transport system ATP-binding protein
MIRCEGLVKIYRIGSREVVALQGLELRVAPGEILGLVGPSGAGKSTLLNILGGLDRPSAGQVWVNERNLAELSEAALDRYRREGVGFVWQQSGRNLIGYLTALENVMLPMQLARVPRRERRARAVELLTAVGLAARMDHVPIRLSGGEQQRVAIAVALANHPALLLADEPTGEMDTATAREIYALFRDLVRRMAQQTGPRLTIVIVSHDPAIAAHVDRVVSIRDGKTSTETVRVARNAVAPAAAAEDASLTEQDPDATDETYSEYVVVDSVGRLQIPQDLREAYRIAGRVLLERHPDGILIQPEDGREADTGVS